MKNKLVLFIAGCCGMLFSACLGTKEYNYELGKDCRIITFSLSNDSIKGLSDVVFTIDQVNGRIFNADSMPYGTVLNQKVVCKIQMGQAVYNCQVYPGVGEAFYWNMEDSLDFSREVRFVTKSLEGDIQKTYIAKVNIHQVVPDSMSWSQLTVPAQSTSLREEKVVVLHRNETDYYYMYTLPTDAHAGYRLYRTPVSNPADWTELPVSGLPSGEIRLHQLTVYENRLFAVTASGALYISDNGETWSVAESAPVVKSLIGSLSLRKNASGEVSRPALLAAVIEKEGNAYWATMDPSMQWTEGNALPATGFPVDGFAATLYQTAHHSHLLILGGKDRSNSLLNTVWITDDGREWVKISRDEAASFEKQEGAAVIVYDDKLFMLSGIQADGKASSAIYWSKDGGLNWKKSTALVLMPDGFKPRGFTSIHVDKQQHLFLFGGKETRDSGVLNQIWRGRINRLGFKE